MKSNESVSNATILKDSLKRYIVTSSINDLLSDLNKITEDSDCSLILIALSESTYFFSFKNNSISPKSSMTVSGISRRLNIPKNTVSRKIKKLVEMGYLIREHRHILFRLDQGGNSIFVQRHPEISISLQRFCEKIK